MTFLLVNSVSDTCVSLLLLGHVVLGLQVGLLRGWGLFMLNGLSWGWVLFNWVVIILHPLVSFSMMGYRSQRLGGSYWTLINIISLNHSVSIDSLVGSPAAVTGPRSFVVGDGYRLGGWGSDRDRSGGRCGSGCNNWRGCWCRGWLNCFAKSMGNQILLRHNIILHLASCMVGLLWEVSLTGVIILFF